MAKISGKFLQKCLTDEESRQKLFDNLRAAEDSYASRKDEVGFLQQDLQELEDGYKQNACDATEVEKAKKLIEQAKQQMGRLPDRAPTMAESSTMTINMLI